MTFYYIVLFQLHELHIDTSSYDWLVTARSNRDFGFINDILNATSVRFDQNIVVAYVYSKYVPEMNTLGLCDNNFIYKVRNYPSPRTYREKHVKKLRLINRNNQNIKTEYETNYYRTTERFRNLTRNKTYKSDGNILPLFQSGVISYNYSRVFNMINISRFSLTHQIRQCSLVHRLEPTERIISVMQYFKVRANSTLYAYFLGEFY